MKRIIHPTTPAKDVEAFLEKQAGPKVPDKPISEISIDGLLGDGLLSLYREMRNLLLLSSKGKLGAADSRDLRDTVKLLFELKDREKELLAGLEDEELNERLETKNDNE